MKREKSQERLCVLIVSHVADMLTDLYQFYNAVLFMGSVAVFSLIAQKLNAGK